MPIIKDLQNPDSKKILVLKENNEKVRKNLPEDTLDISAGKVMSKPKKVDTRDLQDTKKTKERKNLQPNRKNQSMTN